MSQRSKDRAATGRPVGGVRHRGELVVRHRVGVPGADDPRLPTVRETIPRGAARFLMMQPMVILAAPDPDGAVWATVWAGPPGFAAAEDERTVGIVASPGPRDPVVPLLRPGADVGILVIEPASRVRIRINGTVQSHEPGRRLTVRTQQVYGNCPKYIQARRPERVADHTVGRHDGGGAQLYYEGNALNERQIEAVRAADTFFIGTWAPAGGADASHRGGNPGFVVVHDERHLSWPDYPGNVMFMTLGNLELHPHAGLVVPHWQTGGLLHLSGRAATNWDPPHALFPGAQRAVDFTVEKVVERPAALPLRWRFEEYSPFNPLIAS